VSVTTSKISDDDHRQHEALVRDASKATGWSTDRGRDLGCQLSVPRSGSRHAWARRSIRCASPSLPKSAGTKSGWATPMVTASRRSPRGRTVAPRLEILPTSARGLPCVKMLPIFQNSRLMIIQVSDRFRDRGVDIRDMRNALEDVMTRVPAEYGTAAVKVYLAECILKARPVATQTIMS
jgi:hypothetical protein